jgi:hypothetical protein
VGAYYRAMRARKGPQQATVATAHKIARIVYHLLKYGEAYEAESADAYEQKRQERECASCLVARKSSAIPSHLAAQINQRPRSNLYLCRVSQERRVGPQLEYSKRSGGVRTTPHCSAESLAGAPISNRDVVTIDRILMPFSYPLNGY